VTIRRTSALASGIVLGLLLAPLASAAPPALAQQEVDYLLHYIGNSGCEFKRNGAWNNAKAAEEHVRGKYDFLAAQDRIDSTQDFIDKAATASSLTGQPYEIRCAGAAPAPSSLWLSRELARYRASQR